VGSFVARSALKDAVLEAATSAVVASSFAASVFFSGSSTRSKPRDVFVDASFARNVTAARRDGFLGLHHDAITGTCPADVAEDYFAMARRAVTASRRAIRQTARVALECDEDDDELLDDADEKKRLLSVSFPQTRRRRLRGLQPARRRRVRRGGHRPDRAWTRAGGRARD
jgi:hypothetical protein